MALTVTDPHALVGRLLRTEAQRDELLENLKALVGLAEKRCRALHEYGAAIQSAREAIAKAEGA